MLSLFSSTQLSGLGDVHSIGNRSQSPLFKVSLKGELSRKGGEGISPAPHPLQLLPELPDLGWCLPSLALQLVEENELLEGHLTTQQIITGCAYKMGAAPSQGPVFSTQGPLCWHCFLRGAAFSSPPWWWYQHLLPPLGAFAPLGAEASKPQSCCCRMRAKGPSRVGKQLL